MNFSFLKAEEEITKHHHDRNGFALVKDVKRTFLIDGHLQKAHETIGKSQVHRVGKYSKMVEFRHVLSYVLIILILQILINIWYLTFNQ